MPNWFKDLFYSNITYVANAYSHSECVWLIFKTEELKLETVSADLISANVTWKCLENKGGVRVPFNERHIERRNNDYDYLSAYTKTRDGAEMIICKNMKIPRNRSYIITNKGGIIESGMGKPPFEDVHGNNHKV